MVLTKKGISAIVATVLILLISIVGVGIIWGGIMPLFKDLNYISYADIKLDIVTQGYTVYDPELHFAFVQVARGKDNLNLTALEVSFNIEGNSVTYRNYDVPSNNGKKTYKYNFTRDGIVGDPKSVSVAPVFTLGGQEKVGEIISTKEIPVQSVELAESEWEESDTQSVTSVIKGSSADSGSSSPVPCSSNVTCDDGNSCTLNDTRICNRGILGNCAGIAPLEIYNNAVDENCDGFANLNDCTTLNVAGAVYRLDNSVTTLGNCFTITASNIILEGNGKNITGDGNSETDVGIATSVDSNLVNLTIKNFGNIGNIGKGISLDQVNNSLVYNNTFVSQIAPYATAIYFENGDSNRVENNKIRWNTTGSSSPSEGIYFRNMYRGFGRNNITGNSITLSSLSSPSRGISFGNSGNFSLNVIQHNNITIPSSPTGIGVYLFGGPGSLMEFNTVQHNAIDVSASSSSYGIFLFNNPLQSQMHSNTLQFNTITIRGLSSYGISLLCLPQGTSMSFNTVQSNVVNITSSSSGYGVYLSSQGETSNNNLFQENTLAVNASTVGYGFYMANRMDYKYMRYNSFLNNTACSLVGTNVSGFYCSGSVTGTLGSGNQFGGTVTACFGGWPVLGSNYTSC